MIVDQDQDHPGNGSKAEGEADNTLPSNKRNTSHSSLDKAVKFSHQISVVYK